MLGIWMFLPCWDNFTQSSNLMPHYTSFSASHSSGSMWAVQLHNDDLWPLYCTSLWIHHNSCLCRRSEEETHLKVSVFSSHSVCSFWLKLLGLKFSFCSCLLVFGLGLFRLPLCSIIMFPLSRRSSVKLALTKTHQCLVSSAASQ